VSPDNFPAKYSLVTSAAAATSRNKSIFFISLVILFITSAWYMICVCGIPLTQVKFTFMKNVNEGLAVQGQVALAKTLPWTYTQNWPKTINVLLSDFIVCWRTWALFWDDKVWKVILVIFMGANTGINIAEPIWDDIDVIILAGLGSGVLDWLSTAISLSVNLLATAMVAYRAWRHYHFMAEASIAHKSRSIRLMLLLVESGAIFCAFQFLYTVVSILSATLPIEQPTSKWKLSSLVITQIFVVTTALYPVAVCIFIHTTDSATQSRLDAISSIDIPLEEVPSSPLSSEIPNVIAKI
jgi:hypothetical protein